MEHVDREIRMPRDVLEREALNAAPAGEYWELLDVVDSVGDDVLIAIVNGEWDWDGEE